jgi:hypothetical protein
LSSLNAAQKALLFCVLLASSVWLFVCVVVLLFAGLRLLWLWFGLVLKQTCTMHLQMHFHRKHRFGFCDARALEFCIVSAGSGFRDARALKSFIVSTGSGSATRARSNFAS